MTIQSNRFENLRGGKERRISFAEYFKSAAGRDSDPFVIEKMVLPELGEEGWGYFIVREGATRSPKPFRRTR